MLRTVLILQILTTVLSDGFGQEAPVRRRQKLVINYGGGGWKDNQVQEPCILVNPKDPSKLIMFYGGATTQAKGGNGSLGKAWANVSDPFTWHEDAENPIFQSDPNIPFEARSVRLDSVIYHEATEEYWIYYTGTAQAATQADATRACDLPRRQRRPQRGDACDISKGTRETDFIAAGARPRR